MTAEPSRRRYLSLWLPYLSADGLRLREGDFSFPLVGEVARSAGGGWLRALTPRGSPPSAPSGHLPHKGGGKAEQKAGGKERPLVFIEKTKGRSLLVRLDGRAMAEGLRAGMTLADARARIPQLRAVALDPAADAAFLARLADLAISFTPSVALEEPDGLVLDITGCAHLFGGERGLAARFVRALRAAGVSLSRMAVAPTPDMARALARFGQTCSGQTCFSLGNPIFAADDSLVRTLPVAALECNAEDSRALKRAGLRDIADVADRPSVLFTARFTAAFTIKLARVLGEEDRRITPRRLPPPCRLDHRCPQPVITSEAILAIIEQLAQGAAKLLGERGEGGRIFETAFFRSDGAVRRIKVETSQPTTDPRVVLRLYRDRLDALADPLDPGFGFDLIRFHVVRTEPFGPRQISLDAHEETGAHLAGLIDRLGAIFGPERVIRLLPADTHIPERAQVAVPAGDARATSSDRETTWEAPEEGAPPRRPLHLFDQPQPIDMLTASGGGKLAGFRWRRTVQQIAGAEGPERIAGEWWRARAEGETRDEARDYYRVETVEGRRFWIFRTPAPEGPPRWFMHGVFP